MFKGVFFALSACFIWGLIFVVPEFMVGFSALEVALGRYLFYGIISVVIFLRAKSRGTCSYPLAIWKKALWFSLIASMGYYTFVVMALRYSTPAICALVLGVSPITIAFYGNWREKEVHFKNLILPSILIGIGLVLINIPPLLSTESTATYLLGLVCSFAALVSWTWYAVANAQFLKKNPKLLGSDWSTMMGVSALFWVFIFASTLCYFSGNVVSLAKYQTLNPMLIKFLAGSAVLGFLCSWVGAFLWNRASVYLQISLAGQLMIFETIFGLVYVYIIDQRFPPKMEALAILFFLVAVAYGIKSAVKAQEQVVAIPVVTEVEPEVPEKEDPHL